MAERCLIVVLLAVFAAGCGSGSDADRVDSGAGQEDGQAQAGLATQLDLRSCADVPEYSSDLMGALGTRSNPDPLLMGVMRTYGMEHPDTFGGLWIDRRSEGVIVIAFTDDPEPHRAELANRGPRETDEVGVQPPPPITDPRPLGERDDFVFDVVQVPHSEATLRATQREVESLFQVEGSGLSGVGVAVTANLVFVDLLDPTSAGLEEVARVVADLPVCVTISRSPTPPAGELDIIGAADEAPVFPAGLSEVRWELDPAYPPPGPDAAEIHVLATELGCASGREIGDALRGPQVVETDTEVVIAFAVESPVGGQNCQGNPSTPVTVLLAEPVGDRELRDGGDSRIAAAAADAAELAVHDLLDQPNGGDRWRLLSSTQVVDGWNPPVAATSLEEFWLLSDTFWEVELNAEAVDFSQEIVVAMPVEMQRGQDLLCGPHVIDDVRVDDGVLRYELRSPLHDSSAPCDDAARFQVFVVSLDRSDLPDLIRIPNRNTLVEVRVGG